MAVYVSEREGGVVVVKGKGRPDSGLEDGGGSRERRGGGVVMVEGGGSQI